MNWLKKPVVVALSLAVIAACVWMFFPAPRNRPMDRRISNVAVSPTGAWIAAGTAQGPVTISNGRPGTAGGFIPLRRGPLNDLQFSPDERLLAIAGKDLALYRRSATYRMFHKPQRGGTNAMGNTTARSMGSGKW
jgi:hypothetical protein